MPRFNSEDADDLRVDFRVFRGRRVVLLIRNPCDALVSLYMQNVHRADPPLYEGTVDGMVGDRIYGIEKFINYYGQWHANRHVPREFMLVRYEELSSNTAGVMRDALKFLGVPGIEESFVRRVVEYGSFANMRELERTDALRLPTLGPSRRPGADAFKVRKGIVGGYVEHMNEKTISHIAARVDAALPSFYGYCGSISAERVSSR
jgi:hypothetical protein